MIEGSLSKTLLDYSYIILENSLMQGSVGKCICVRFQNLNDNFHLASA